MSNLDKDLATPDVKAVIWISAVIHEFRDMGVVDGGGDIEISPKGLAAFDQIEKDFKPTDLQLLAYAPTIVPTGSLEDLTIIVELMKMYRDDKDRFLEVSNVLQHRGECDLHAEGLYSASDDDD